MTNRKNLLIIVLRRSLALALFLLTAFTLALAERHERVVDSWRPTHYDITLKLNDTLTELSSAQAEISINILKGPLDTLDLDFGDMPVDSVMVGNEPTRFEQHNGQLSVQLPKPANRNEQFTIVVTYHGRPKDGLILTADKAGKPSATGDNWPDRTHNWIPCLDHPSAKATVNFTVTAPARDTVVANGQLTATRNNADTTRTWTFTEARPIPAYCMVIAVGEYAQSQPPMRTVTPLNYYVPQTDGDYAVQGFSAAPLSLSLFSEKVAPYPYEKLALIVGATRFGGMENSSAIVFSSNFFDARTEAQPTSRTFNIRRGIVETTAHEIAHQWFGDSVSIKTWADLWLSEGFATYFAGLFVERYEGKEAFRDYMHRAAEQYFAYEREHRTPIHDTETEDLFKLLNRNNYEKGAWVLHMLRGTLGDTAFFKGIRAYYLAHENGTASTEDLRAALEKASGVDLKEFFARWVYASGHPSYEASWTWQSIRGKRGVLTIQLRQTQTDAPFLTPLPIEIVTSNGVQRTTLKPTGKETTTRISLASQPTDVRIDPDEIVLKEIVIKNMSLR
ncbi:MAG TPA: M1 family aminopeptidase [Pyrinomonadaceae bacterium]|nr:M1 family aminopeptidase [Pyrinomonadaceae bacterium]